MFEELRKKCPCLWRKYELFYETSSGSTVRMEELVCQNMTDFYTLWIRILSLLRLKDNKIQIYFCFV